MRSCSAMAWPTRKPKTAGLGCAKLTVTDRSGEPLDSAGTGVLFGGPFFGTVNLFIRRHLKTRILSKRGTSSAGDRAHSRAAARRGKVPTAMSTLHFRRIERRRTPRVTVFADLTIQGYLENDEKFKVRRRSLSVSGHGGLTILDAAVVVGQTLLVRNENSGQKTECRIVSIRPGGDGKSIVAFEFIGPCANFWKITFPAQGAKPPRRFAPATVRP